MGLPYATATSGQSAVSDIRKIVQKFGCSKFAPMEDFTSGEITVQFEYRGRMVQVTASSVGYARALMREKPHTTRMRKSIIEYEKACLKQGQIAVWSILRDWIKGQLMAVETEVLSFDSAFLGQILLPDGRTVHDRVAESDTLPALQKEGE